MPLGEACQRLYERMPVPEANFFGIVIAIQQKSGGNLSEALGNLSKVLRDRKKMKARSRRCRWKRRPPPPSSARCRPPS
jgi:tight adherence protein B